MSFRLGSSLAGVSLTSQSIRRTDFKWLFRVTSSEGTVWCLTEVDSLFGRPFAALNEATLAVFPQPPSRLCACKGPSKPGACMAEEGCQPAPGSSSEWQHQRLI